MKLGSTKEPIINDVWEKKIKQTLEKLWENRLFITNRNLKLLETISNKRS